MEKFKGGETKLKISKTALDQYRQINKLMLKSNNNETTEIKTCLKYITDFGFDIMNNINHDKALQNSNIMIANRCINGMRRINEIAIKKSIRPIFIIKNDLIMPQSINMINAIIIITTVKKAKDST